MAMMKKIRMGNSLFALVDAADFAVLSKRNWFPRRSGRTTYAQCNLGRTTLQMHRVILGAKPGEIVDHINGDGLDNRRKNLRFATKAQNCQNRINVRSDNQSGHTGVSPRGDGKWRAYAYWNKTTRWLGTFATKDEAILARKEFEAKERA